MSGRYRGRRGAPLSFLAPVVVLVLALALLLINVWRHGRNVAGGEDPGGTTADPEVIEPVVEDPTGEETPPESEPVLPARIEINGDTEQTGGVYRVGDTGYEMYTYVDSTAQKYAACVNQTADELKGVARVFAMPVPLSSGITLPDDLYGQDVFFDQKEAETAILGHMNGNVIGIPLYDALMRHRTEYLYYRADHHWTGLGAYYAYVEYCAAAGLTAHDITDYKTVDFPGYLGSFFNDTGKNAQIGANPDVVTAYFPVANAPMTITDKNGNTYTCDSVICDETNAPAAYKYGAYIYGDNPYTEIKNESLTDGSACVVVKESFGNAYVPFMVDHYQTTYVIDYRYWHGSLKDFVRANNVQDVLFCNNLSAIRNNSLMGSLYGIL